MFLTMSINTENSEDFLLWDISIFKNTVGSHRHLIHTTAVPAVAPVQVLFLQPCSGPGVPVTGRAWLLPAHTARGGSAAATVQCPQDPEPRFVWRFGLCVVSVTVCCNGAFSNQALEEWLKRQNRGFSCEMQVLKCHWRAEIPLISRGCWICRIYAHIDWGYRDAVLAMPTSTRTVLTNSISLLYQWCHL